MAQAEVAELEQVVIPLQVALAEVAAAPQSQLVQMALMEGLVVLVVAVEVEVVSE